MDANSTTVNTPRHPLYALYADEWPCWPLVGLALAFNLVAVPGFAMNLAVVWVTLKNSSLNGTANHLLALCSLFECLHQPGYLLFLYTSASGANFIPYSLAVHLCTPSLFGLGAVPVVMAATGLDRLLSVASPIHWTQWIRRRQVPYLALVALLCVANAAYLVRTSYESIAEMPGLMTTGVVGDLFQGRVTLVFNSMVSAFYTLTSLLYVVVGVLYKCRSAPTHSANAASGHVQRRLFRSLALILTFNVGGYLATAAFLYTLAPHIRSPVAFWFAFQAFGWLANASSASNAPILYWTSGEYQKAFRAELAALRSKIGGGGATNSSAVVVAQIQALPNSRTVHAGGAQATVHPTHLHLPPMRLVDWGTTTAPNRAAEWLR